MNHLDPEITKHFAEDEAYQKTHNDEMMHLNASIATMHEKLDALIVRSKPALEFFDGMSFSKKSIMWILGFLGATGSLVLLGREIFKK